MQSPNRNLLVLALALVLPSSLARAQEAPAVTPVRVELVFSKQQGEKVTARLPYSFLVNAGGEATVFRVGIEVPVTVDAEGKTQYRNVGTNLDCQAREVASGRFQVKLLFEQSSMYPADPGPEASGERNPLFRTFNADISVVLSDEETVEVASATDPISGEVSKVEMSLKRMK